MYVCARVGAVRGSRQAANCRGAGMGVTMWEALLGALAGSGIAGTITGVLLTRREQKITRQVEEEFNRRADQRAYEQQALFELFGPAKMQFLRTRRAFDRWTRRNDFLEARVVRVGNEAIRDLLLAKGHLIPPDLVDHASALIEHYDAWLEAFDLARVTNADAAGGPEFVFVGPSGFPFPKGAEAAFLARAADLQQRLLCGNQP